MILKQGAVLLSVNDPSPIIKYIPHAKLIRFKGRNIVAVKHKLDETKLLRNMGLEVPSPMLYDGYLWPGRWLPMRHQVETAEFLTLNLRAFVLNEMGTGKSSAALWAADYLRERGHLKRILVICPVSVIKVWQDEGFYTTPHRTVGSLVGNKKKRLEILATKPDICVINFDGVVSLKEELAAENFDLIIIDEASAYRNASTQRYKALKSLLQPTTRLWCMTGTPTPNAPTDCWALCRLVNPALVPKSFKLFQETVMRQAGPYKWVPRPGSQEKVWSVMQPAVRFLKKDCLDLPEITYNNRHAELTSEQIKVFDAIRKEMAWEMESRELTAANAAVKVIKLQQICCGVVKDNDGSPIVLDNKPRMDLLLELVEEIGGKTIVFVPFKFSMAQIVEKLKEQGYTAELVNGDVSTGERSRIFSAFQNESHPQILVAHPATAAHGLTLTAASNIIWFAPIYSIEQYEQANARIHRAGQRNVCSIYHIGAHAFEWAIYKVLQNKSALQESILSLYRQVVDGRAARVG